MANIAELGIRIDTLECKLARLELEKLNNTAKSTQTAVERLEKGFKKMARDLAGALGLTAVVAGLVAGFKDAIKTFADFDQAMKNVGSVANASALQMKQLSNAAREMAKTSVFTAREAANAQYYLASAGLKVTQIIDAQRGVMDLAAATQSDLASTSEAVASALSQFSLKAADATRVANTYAAAISASQATQKKLADSMRYAGPIAGQLGQSIEKTTAQLMAMYNAGLRGEQAGTSLRAAMIRLQGSTKEVRDAMAAVGVSIFDASGAARPFEDILKDLAKAHLTAGEAAKVFGQEAVSGMLAIIGNLDKVNSYETAITNTNKANEMAAQQMEGFKNQLKLMQSAWEELQITLVERYAPQIVSAIQSITAAINDMTGALNESDTVLEIANKLMREATGTDKWWQDIPGIRQFYDVLASIVTTAQGWDPIETAKAIKQADLESKEWAASFDDLRKQLDTVKVTLKETGEEGVKAARVDLEAAKKAAKEKEKYEKELAKSIIKTRKEVYDQMVQDQEMAVELAKKWEEERAQAALDIDKVIAQSHGDTQKLKEIQLQEFLQKYRDLLKKHIITQEEFDRIAAAKRIEINKSALQTLLEQWSDINKNIESLTAESLKNIQSQFSNLIKGTLKGELNSLEDIWEATMDAMLEVFINFIAQLLAAWAAAGIADLFGDFFDFDFLGPKGSGGGGAGSAAGGIAGGVGKMLLKKGAGMLWDKVGGELGLPTSWGDVADLLGLGGGSLESGAGAYLGGGESLGMYSGMDQASINAIGEEVAANLGLGTGTGTGAMGGGMGGPMGQGLADLGIGAGAGAAASLASGASAYLGGMYGGMTAAELAALGEGAAAMAGIGGGAGAAAGSSAASGAAAGAGAGASMMAALPIAAILGLAMAMGMPDPVSAIMASGGGHTKGSALNYIGGDIGYLQRAEQSPGGLSLQDMVTNPSTGVVGSGSAVQIERLAERAGLSEEQIDNLILGVDDLIVRYDELNAAAEEAAAAGDQELADSLLKQAEATAQAAAETQAYADALGFDANGLSAVGAAMFEAAQAQAVLQEQTAQISSTYQDWNGSAEQVRTQVADLVGTLEAAGVNTDGMTASTTDLINQMLEGNITLGQMTDSLNSMFSVALEQAANDGSLTADEMEKLTSVLKGTMSAEEAFKETMYGVGEVSNQMASDIQVSADVMDGINQATEASTEALTLFSDTMDNDLKNALGDAAEAGDLTKEQFTDLVELFGQGEGKMGNLGQVLDAGLLSSLEDAIDSGKMTAEEMRAVAEAVASIPEGYTIGVDWNWTNGPPPGYNGGGGGDKKHIGGLIMHSGGLADLAMRSGLISWHGGRFHSGTSGLLNNEVPAILQRGEFVTRANSVNMHTLPVLQEMNRTGEPPRGDGGGIVVNVTGNTFSDPDPARAGRKVAQAVVAELEKMARRGELVLGK